MGREAEEFEMLVGEQKCLEAACMKFALVALKYFWWHTIETQTFTKEGERGLTIQSFHSGNNSLAAV